MSPEIQGTSNNQTPNIQILDAMMGAGKTTYIFKEIQKRSATEVGTRFLYVSPFLAEVGNPDAKDQDQKKQEELKRGRIHLACPAADFQTPESRPTKRASLKRLLSTGKNIACTHALYSAIDLETAQLIEEQEYEVIIDEALEVIQTYKILKKDDATFLAITTTVDPETHLVQWSSPIGKDSRYAETKLLCEEERLYHFRDQFWVWELPPALLIRAKKITICTYMFKASVLHSYLLKHKIAFEYIDTLSIGLTPETTLLKEAKQLLMIEDNPYSQKLSAYSMSSNGYSALTKKDLGRMRGMLEMMLERYLKARSSELIWTCFTKQQKFLSGKGYKRSFLACNARATNDYRTRSVGIYLVDRYPHAMLNTFLRDSGTAIDSDLYGLSEMIQWIWRLRIREGKSIRLVIPSERMKKLLLRWLDGEFIQQELEHAA